MIFLSSVLKSSLRIESIERAKPATGAAAVQTVEILLSLQGSLMSGARFPGPASLTRDYMSSAPAWIEAQASTELG